LLWGCLFKDLKSRFKVKMPAFVIIVNDLNKFT